MRRQLTQRFLVTAESAEALPRDREQRVMRAVLSQFDDLWESMPIRDRSRLIELLIERIDYDGAGGKIKITFHPTGISALGEQLAVPQEPTA